MVGTEKQIVWAEQIKDNMLKGLRVIDFMSKNEKILNNDTATKVLEALVQFREEVENNQDAKWFIEHRELVVNPTTCGYKYETIRLSIHQFFMDTDEDFLNLNKDEKSYKVYSKMYKMVQEEYLELYR